MIITRRRFALALLEELDCPATTANRLALIAWMAAENTRARFNPLATTKPWPGDSKFNHIGVRNYRNFSDGIKATAATVRQHNMAPILRALRDGDNARPIANAIAASRWGTGSLVITQLDKIFAPYNSRTIVRIGGSS